MKESLSYTAYKNMLKNILRVKDSVEPQDVQQFVILKDSLELGEINILSIYPYLSLISYLIAHILFLSKFLEVVESRTFFFLESLPCHTVTPPQSTHQYFFPPHPQTKPQPIKCSSKLREAQWLSTPPLSSALKGERSQRPWP